MGGKVGSILVFLILVLRPVKSEKDSMKFIIGFRVVSFVRWMAISSAHPLMLVLGIRLVCSIRMSISRLNRSGDRGHPCFMPLSRLIARGVEFGIVVFTLMSVRRLVIILMYLVGRLMCFRRDLREEWLMESNAFSKSRNRINS